MIEGYGDLWAAAKEENADAIVITTNGFVKKNGEAVMGRGIALEAKNAYPDLPKSLGSMINKHGNKVFGFYFGSIWLFTVPVKPTVGPNGEPGWRAKAQIPLIEDSIKQLVGAEPYYGLMRNISDSMNTLIEKIYMPRPGCGNGGLKWEVVKPIIEPYLDDRFTVFHKEM